MVPAATRKSRPVTGCDQVFSARERIAAWSDPRAGGELKSEPTTENRNRAHKAPVELGCFRVITSPHKLGEGTVTTSINRLIKLGDEHLLRVESDHRETSICRAPGIVIGERNRRRSVQPLQMRWRERKASTSEYGRETISTTGTKRARAIFQNGVWGKCSRQKTCQRAMVRRSAPKRGKAHGHGVASVLAAWR